MAPDRAAASADLSRTFDEDVDASEYTFRTTVTIETSAPELAWLNDGVFIAVGARRPHGVSYDVYLVA